MPNGSLIPHLYIKGKPMPLTFYIAWFIFAFEISFYGGRTYIEFETARNEFYNTTITLWHGRNEYWHPERGNFTKSTWGIENESQHWVALAHFLEEHGCSWFAKTTILETNVIQCQDALVEGSIFGIKNSALLG